jgi:hypothetical protein
LELRHRLFDDLLHRQHRVDQARRLLSQHRSGFLVAAEVGPPQARRPGPLP